MFNYPMGENSDGHLFWDTMNIQNLIWSIDSEMMFAIMLGFGKGILPPVNGVEIKCFGIGGLLMKPVVIRDIAQ